MLLEKIAQKLILYVLHAKGRKNQHAKQLTTVNRKSAKRVKEMF